MNKLMFIKLEYFYCFVPRCLILRIVRNLEAAKGCTSYHDHFQSCPMRFIYKIDIISEAMFLDLAHVVHHIIIANCNSVSMSFCCYLYAYKEQ